MDSPIYKIQWIELKNPVPGVCSCFSTSSGIRIGDRVGVVIISPLTGLPDNCLWELTISRDGATIIRSILSAETEQKALKAGEDFLWDLGNQFRQTGFDLGLSRIERGH